MRLRRTEVCRCRPRRAGTGTRRIGFRVLRRHTGAPIPWVGGGARDRLPERRTGRREGRVRQRHPAQTRFGPVTLPEWTVPSLDGRITGSGSRAGQVKHTLHRA